MSEFENWWEREGRGYDPDGSEISWYDKRKALAEKAFSVATAISRNYVANEEVMPERVTFANGRVVAIEDNKNPGVHQGIYLAVHQLPD